MSLSSNDLFIAIGFVLGGFAIFIYGITLMSDGLKSIAGQRVREYIEKYTSNLFMAILVGTIITAILHSSTAVTVISISLVRAGLMKLEQAIGITIGANIGTTITSVLIGLDIEKYAYYIAFIGIMFIMISRKKSLNQIGRVILGFGLLFVGLQIMGDQLVLLAETKQFGQFITVTTSNDWLSLLGGTVATGIIQSSTAIVKIIQSLYANGLVTQTAAIAFIYGSNVGTTITALMASAGGSKATIRAALFHTVYNVAGALLGMVIIVPYAKLTLWINNSIGGDGAMYVAMAHVIFNITSTIVVFPFVKQIVKFLEFIVPGEDKKTVVIEAATPMDDSLVEQFPAAALELAKENTIKMGKTVLQAVHGAQVYMNSAKEEDYDEVAEIESIINRYDTDICKYLLKIAQQDNLGIDQSDENSSNFQIVKNFERIGDLATNLIEFFKMVYEEKETFSEEAMADLNKMFETVKNMIPTALEAYQTRDILLYRTIDEDEKYLDILEGKCRSKHFERLKKSVCKSHIAASVFVDILSNMERIGDHANNVVKNIISPVKYHGNEHDIMYSEQIH